MVTVARQDRDVDQPPFIPWSMAKVKGYVYVGGEYCNGSSRGWSPKRAAEVTEALAENAVLIVPRIVVVGQWE